MLGVGFRVWGLVNPASSLSAGPRQPAAPLSDLHRLKAATTWRIMGLSK